MTREEAIEILIAVSVCDRPILSCDFCARYVGTGNGCDEPTDKEIEEAVLLLKGASKDMAISAIRQQETVTNRNGLKVVEIDQFKPLTLDELRKMDNQPVWIEDVGEDKWHGSGWAIVDREYCLVRKASNGNPAFFERYGKEWIAYRQKLAEEDGHA